MPDKSERFREDLLKWADDYLREFPWRDGDATVYEVFLAEFLLVQTPAERVASVLPGFVEEFPDPAALEAAPKEDIAEALETLGLQHRRARALKEIAADVEDGLPRDPERMRKLPRVGPYISNATAVFAYGEVHPLLDTNIRRVLGRLFGDEWPEDESDQLAFVSALLVGIDDVDEFYFALLDFAALVCKARSPRCEECFARSYCDYFQNQVDDP